MSQTHSFDSWKYFLTTIQEHRSVLDSLVGIERQLLHAAEMILSVIHSGKKILLCGNGGSAADCQHFATELTIRFEKNRKALGAIALTTDTSALTAAVNDFGIEAMFSRQVDAIGHEGDLLIGITTSGKSSNIISALNAAKSKGIHTLCLTGKDGGDAAKIADHYVIVPSDSTARIQEMHIIIVHYLCGLVDASFDQ